MNKRESICEAINNRNLLSFKYKGHRRIVQPHLVGIKHTGNYVLSAWFVDGHSTYHREPPLRNYLLSDIHFIEILTDRFTGTRPGYNRNDRTMSRILCRI